MPTRRSFVGTRDLFQLSGSVSRVDNCHNRHARDEQTTHFGRGYYRDTNRYPLNNLGEIPCGVFGRQDRKFCSGSGRDALNASSNLKVGKSIDLEPDRLPRPQKADLRLLEICDYVDFVYRSEACRVGKECVSTCKTQWETD